MPLSSAELNRLSDHLVSQDLTMRLHSASPGSTGTQNRIGSAEVTLTASNWTSAANGDVTYTNNLNFPALSTSASSTVAFYTVWRGSGNNAELVLSDSFAASATVPANGTLTVNANTLIINGSTA